MWEGAHEETGHKHGQWGSVVRLRGGCGAAQGGLWRGVCGAAEAGLCTMGALW